MTQAPFVFDSPDKVRQFDQASREIHAVLRGKPPEVQGAILADLVAMWLAGHRPPEVREPFFKQWRPGADWRAAVSGQRQCGSCTLCCKLVPVEPDYCVDDEGKPGAVFNGKPAMTRCEHQCSKGCRIYNARPFACRMWSCTWLVDKKATMLPRPDRAHYVIDIMPETITLKDDRTGEVTRLQAVQVWIDPDHPDAHRAPALREYLAMMGRDFGTVAIVRGANERRRQGKGMVIFPPAMSADHQWHEQEATMHGHGPRTEHPAETLRKMGITLAPDFRIEIK